MATIQELINNRHKYKVDATYQRPEGAWSTQDNACLIDSILRGEPIPLFFLNERWLLGQTFYVCRLNHYLGLKLTGARVYIWLAEHF